MSNRLKMAMIETILLLSARGWSTRRIGRELGIHRDTVARHLPPQNRPQRPTGSDHPADEAKPATAPHRVLVRKNRPQRPGSDPPSLAVEGPADSPSVAAATRKSL